MIEFSIAIDLENHLYLLDRSAKPYHWIDRHMVKFSNAISFKSHLYLISLVMHATTDSFELQFLRVWSIRASWLVYLLLVCWPLILICTNSLWEHAVYNKDSVVHIIKSREMSMKSYFPLPPFLGQASSLSSILACYQSIYYINAFDKNIFHWKLSALTVEGTNLFLGFLLTYLGMLGFNVSDYY